MATVCCVGPDGQREEISVSKPIFLMFEAFAMLEGDSDGWVSVDVEADPKVVRLAFEFCYMHLDDPYNMIEPPLRGNPLSLMDQEFASRIDSPTLGALGIFAMKYMCDSLLNATLVMIALRIRGRSEKEIQETFQIPQLSIEEEIQQREKNPWIYDF